MRKIKSLDQTDLIVDTDPWKLEIPSLPERERDSILKTHFDDPKAVNDLQYILRDIMQGDDSLRDREEYKHLNLPLIRVALEWLIEEEMMDDKLKVLLAAEPWRMTFKREPPTPKQFLDEKYLGPMVENLWRPLRRGFVDFFDPLRSWRTAVLAASIGSGKSTLTCLIFAYIAVCFALMWSPHKYFSKMSTSVFALVFCAVSQKKSSEVYLEPILQLFESSPYFERLRTHGEMKEAEQINLKRSDVEKIQFTTSTPSSVLQSLNGLNWKMIANATSLLGVNILGGAMTELSFFHEAGWGEEKIRTFFTKLRQRISNRFSNSYYARMILDSSPYSTENFPDSWIWGEAQDSTDNFFYTGSRWDLFPEEFPDTHTVEYDEETGHFTKLESHYDWDNSFMLFRGGNEKLPQVVEDEPASRKYDAVDMIKCPKKRITPNGVEDYLSKANENPMEFMRDICGVPSGTADRIFWDNSKVEACFSSGLKNVYGCIKAPAMEDPEHLIWNQISTQFFYKVMDKYHFYYAPELVRCISVDQSLSKDMTSIAMSHVEFDPDRIDSETRQPVRVFITDFTIMINPKGGLINLDAIKFFIWDLRRLGNLRIVHTSFDGYESASTKQFLLRNGFTIDYVSMDRDNAPYQTFIDMVFKNRWYCGRNVFVKNNMKSLQMRKRRGSGSLKIDHSKGELIYDVTGNWDTDTAGVNAKDSTDAIAGNIWLMQSYMQDFPPIKKFNPVECLDRTYESVIEKSSRYLDSMNLI